jgi:uncharacterized protein GlcG (DUF336 family)
MRLTLEGARVILAAAVRKASALGVPMDLAVTDDGGHLLAFNRMDGAMLTCIDVSIAKAWTAACARRPTHEIAEIAGPGRPAYGIHISNPGRFTIVGGGIPIEIGGQVVGGVGCSGGTIHQDREVVMAGIRALTSRLSATIVPPRPKGRARKRRTAHPPS